MIDKLIINADDFGMCESVTKGILYGHEHGIITSSTIMMNMPYALPALKLSLDHPIPLGVHLNITIGRPLTKGTSFIKDGLFKRPKDYPDGIKVNPKELYVEWCAQIEAFIHYTHHKPDHIDSHHNIHLLYPEVYKEVSQRYDLPVRHLNAQINNYQATDCFHFKDNLCNLYEFNKILKEHDGILEIMTHPGFLSEELQKMSSYSDGRKTELDFWCDPAVRELISKQTLISFQDIKKQ